MITMDERLLVDSFSYEEFLSEDRNHKPVYAPSEMIDKARIDRSNVFSSDSNEQKIIAIAVIFCYSGLTTNFKPFKERSRVFYDGTYKIIQKVVPVTQPYSNDIFAYELEVL